ncbi:kinetochore-associated Ndc80 complex subunit ndc80 [Phytophthora pseudosyringae]|uniref:Kinetochore protein NDC80 n=1 Tax=Phytophthora pseudosyringae TaxID=221518 RepID=A0A8T1WBD0_9STRA|nr:kinetochore-associated Ndc80 complex subunit ndc80 [Phytophthora pseudosyringae]
MRRTTLGPVSSSQLNSRSSVLRHPSARVSVPSKSMASTERQSVGVVSRRVSTAARRPPTGARASVNPRQSVGTNRRNSSYSSRASVSGRGGGRVLDPRPVSDRSYLDSCVHTLVEFLGEHMYDQTLPQGLPRRGPSKKVFCSILLLLFKQVDPTFEFGVKFEEDVVLQFRNLRYPIPISKTSLAAVGTPHTWPTLLLSISWLIELLSYDEAIQQANEAEQNDEGDEENGDKSFFKYLDASYHVFLAGEDDKFAALEQQEREKLIARNEVVKQETSELEQQREDLKRRIEKAKREKNALSELNKKKSDCESDLVKFRVIVNGYEKVNAKLEKKMESLAETQQSYEEELATRQEEIQSLQTRIENQELSAYDIAQIAQERARLTDQLHQVCSRQDEYQKQIKSDENRAAKIRDGLESQIHEYMTACKRLKIIPVTAKNSLKFDYMIALDPNLEELDAVQKLTHHLKTEVRQAALELKQNRIARANAGLDEALVLDEELKQCENQRNIETQNEKKWDAEVKKFAEQMLKEREKRDESLRRKSAATEEVEIKITNIINEENLAEEEAISRQYLLDVRKASVEMAEAYQAMLDKNRHAVTNVLMACTNHKAMVDRSILSLETEVGKVEL